MSFLLRVVPFLAVGLVVACNSSTPLGHRGMVTRDDVASLEAAILALGPGIDPAEAARAALITYQHTAVLAAEYQIEDPPLIHNAKVNLGTKPRGLCWHWAEDIELRLLAEGFKTLDIHRGIANATNIRIEHSTAIVSRKGDWMYDGIVLDPWRYGGVLFWSGTREDPSYEWHSQEQVLFKRRLRRSGGLPRSGY